MSQHTSSDIYSPKYSYGPATPWQYPAEDGDLYDATPDWRYSRYSTQSASAGHRHTFFPPSEPDSEFAPGDRQTWTAEGETVYSDESSTLNGSRSPVSGGHGGRLSPESPILVSPERASDYAKMSMTSATPPPSNTSINTYIHRFVNLVKKIHRMPWVAPERVTVDYYPEKGKQRTGKGMDLDDLYDRRDMHVTAVSWKSRDYIAWRESHYARVAGFSTTASEAGRTSLPFSPLSNNSSDYDDGSPGSDVAAIIEPFPYPTYSH